jgi:hypothetical protein
MLAAVMIRFECEFVLDACRRAEGQLELLSSVVL